MKTSTISILSVPLLAAGSIALSGCGRSTSAPTTITYHQVGICTGYQTQGTAEEKAGSNDGFAVFKIESIDNTKYGSLFYLDPERFYVNQSDAEQLKKNVYSWNRRFVNPDPRFGKAMGVKYITTVTIPAGQKLDDVGFALVPLSINNPTGGPEADALNFKLAYDTGTNERGNIESVNEGIVLVKTNPADTKYTVVPDCKDLPLK
jgi:hypothetical protein